MQTRMVAQSLAGRDAGEWFVVLSSEGDFVTIANGKSRPLETPKRKRLKHLSQTEQALPETALASNRALRRALREFYKQKEEGGK